MSQPTQAVQQALREAQWACELHVGGRDEQQDAVQVFESSDGKGFLLIVADGMGGHRGGSLASETLTEVAGGLWLACDEAPRDPGAFLDELIQRGHDEINRRGRERGLEPRSTVVVLVVREGNAWWAHVGDSRLYHFRSGSCLHRTRDDSLVQVMLDAGEITPEEAENHPDQNRVLRSIGGDENLKIQYGGTEILPGDGFVLCSDGLWGPLTDEELAALVEEPDVKSAAHSAVAEAVRRGGASADNVSLAVLRLGGGQPSSPRTWQAGWVAAAIGSLSLAAVLGGYLLLGPEQPDPQEAAQEQMGDGADEDALDPADDQEAERAPDEPHDPEEEDKRDEQVPDEADVPETERTRDDADDTEEGDGKSDELPADEADTPESERSRDEGDDPEEAAKTEVDKQDERNDDRREEMENADGANPGDDERQDTAGPNGDSVNEGDTNQGGWWGAFLQLFRDR
ncbi:protein phosphatase 2C domain-containing protein [Halorhodospira sp. 9622]|uniref:protein phosphatase 2C domain-containing protein n=1 Tax=Halorhodospira sp. 9622 TaxID=2899136 RepID=UPI001EE7855A|nr:protein phosphatase 2C domain-containing protein [Halorhodospira sp. 9622]MCG5539353.1 protein phosphatase 2C domain-containing protein [Halorhodospira sp. 9622]